MCYDHYNFSNETIDISPFVVTADVKSVIKKLIIIYLQCPSN